MAHFVIRRALDSVRNTQPSRCYWLNFGSGWAHLAYDEPAQILTGAALRLYYDVVTGDWRQVIEATKLVTGAVLNVWPGINPFSNDPVGQYTRLAGCDPTATFTVEAQ